MYCRKCGGKVDSYASNCPFCGEPTNGGRPNSATVVGDANTPHNRGILGWILVEIVVALPIIGIIMTLVWSFGKKTRGDLTFRNWARSRLVLWIIGLIIGAILVTVVVTTGGWDKLVDIYKNYGSQFGA